MSLPIESPATPSVKAPKGPSLADRPRYSRQAFEALRSALALALIELACTVAWILATTLVLGLATGESVEGSRLVGVMPWSIALAFTILGLYPGTALNAVVEVRRILAGSVLALGLYVVYSFGLERSAADYTTLVGVGVTLPLLQIAARALSRTILARTSWWGQSAMVVGMIDGDALSRRTRQLRYQGLRPVPALLDIESEESWETVQQSRPNWVIVSSQDPIDDVLRQRFVGRFPHVLVVAPRMGETFGRLWLEPLQVGHTSAMHVKNRLHSLPHRFSKRLLDLAICVLSAPLLLPLVVLIAIAVKIDSKGPVFYGHRRLGRDGRWFKAWKFRTMVADADVKLAAFLEAHPELREEWERDQKLRNDPRITRLGRFLRLTSLDELPQLGNVFVGQMSTVGPRPIVEDEVRRYGQAYELYTRVRPGITGLWQVSGRNDTTYQERVSLDATYVRNWSISFDLYVLLRTVKTVLFCEGAC